MDMKTDSVTQHVQWLLVVERRETKACESSKHGFHKSKPSDFLAKLA